MMKAKIHRAVVTEAELHYEGSMTVDKNLMDAAGMAPNEMIKVYNVNSGDRYETYIIPGPAGSGVICLNGAAARKGQKGDRVIMVTSCWLEDKEVADHKPKVVLVDRNNCIKNPDAKEKAGNLFLAN
jgi:aspartate 1-decarboxylase